MKKNIKSQRQLRVGEQLKHLISEVIMMGDLQSKKVRETLITVTEVNVSPDLKKATVFVVSGDNKKNFIKNLNKKNLFLKKKLLKN
jgi:ribosome-binding factor A